MTSGPDDGSSHQAQLHAGSGSASPDRGEDAHPDAGERPRVDPGGSGEPTSTLLGRLSGRASASTRYRLQGEVAAGGMGAVLRVWDEDLRRHLAMKVMLGKGRSPERADTPEVDPRTLARFLEEAQVTGQLDHPGIVPVHELGLDAAGRVYFTMKLVKGETLEDVFGELADATGAWTQTRVLGLILKVCEAMSYAHAKGVIHRDLKPANVMVGHYGEVYVMDWGLAKVLGRADDKDIRLQPAGTSSLAVRTDRKESGDAADSPLYTMDGDVVGTPAYMPPEQARGDLDAMGPHSDVYAVGAMLYHLLAGHMPYLREGERASNYAIWRWVKDGPPADLTSEGPGAPAELVAICDKAMARESGARYPDMTALAADLSAYVEGRVVAAYETGTWAETKKWVRRNKPLAASIAAALVLSLAGLGVSLDQKARADAKTVEAGRNLALAQAAEAEARTQQERAEAQTAKVLRLSDVKVLQDLERDAQRLWPAHPDRIPDLEAWLERARDLASRLPEHRRTLASMRGRAHPWSEEERRRDREEHPRADELAQARSEMDALLARLDENLEADERMTLEERLAELEPLVADLAEEVGARGTWSFDTAEDEWQHDVLAELVADLEDFEAGLLATDAIGEEHGWSVPKRLAFARDLRTGFADGGAYAEAWERALPAIQAAYPGLDLAPQVGLLPLGPDPESGLQEFAHLMSGAPAERGPDGRLALTERTGVVLVLLPGGRFWMGAQASDPDAPNYDPGALPDEGPVHEVELSPFFLSKYEMTQGQWKHVTGRNPAFFGSDNKWGHGWLSSGDQATLLHPVESVSWVQCLDHLPRIGLTMPSEAQWEYAARAGTHTPFWSGSDLASLEGVANLTDAYGKTHGNELWEMWEPDFDDGATTHYPVGSSRPNPFGLHEVHGNLWELCLDGFDSAYYAHSPLVDPVAPQPPGTITRVTRGGSFNAMAAHARCAYRNYSFPTRSVNPVGVRPARTIDR